MWSYVNSDAFDDMGLGDSARNSSKGWIIGHEREELTDKGIDFLLHTPGGCNIAPCFQTKKKKREKNEIDAGRIPSALPKEIDF